MSDAQGFNEWHADIASSPACNLIFQQALDLPAEVVSNSLLPWAGTAEVAATLRLAPGKVLVDLACGRGGYGREVARRTGARLVGVDFSAIAVAIAARSAITPGSVWPTSLPSGCVTAAPTRSCALMQSSSASHRWRPCASAAGS